MAGVDLIQQQGKKFDSLSVKRKDIYSGIIAALYALYACGYLYNTCTVYVQCVICRFCRNFFFFFG